MRRLLTIGAIGAGLLIAGVVAFAAYTALTNQPQSPSSAANLAPENCSPGPCTNVQGYTIWISNVQVSGTTVAMIVKFKNSSSSTHASPEDLSLIDSGRNTSGLITDSTNCNTWTRHEFNSGATFGPINVCFKVNDPTPPFLLHWTPDFGFFCCTADIKITL